MRKLVVVGMCLLFSLFVALAMRPDDGTQVSISPRAETGAAVWGANHGTPLPGVPDASRLLAGLAALLSVAVAMPALTPAPLHVARDSRHDRHTWRSALLARTGQRRGPPRWSDGSRPAGHPRA
ncbi:MAG TPA: hypothetical protein VFZ30_14350 [Acidimicrobiales bacterium]